MGQLRMGRQLTCLVLLAYVVSACRGEARVPLDVVVDGIGDRVAPVREVLGLRKEGQKVQRNILQQISLGPQQYFERDLSEHGQWNGLEGRTKDFVVEHFISQVEYPNGSLKKSIRNIVRNPLQVEEVPEFHQGDFKYTVALIYKEPAWSDKDALHICSGALIENDIVLTAAHCHFAYGSEDNLYACVDVNQETFGRCVGVKQFVVPTAAKEQYRKYKLIVEQDVGLVKLKFSLNGDGIEPVKMNFDAVTHGQESVTLGYGNWGESPMEEVPIENHPQLLPDPYSEDFLSHSETSRKIRHNSMSTVGAEDCLFHTLLGVRDVSLICARSLRDHGTACIGDSGGPLVVGDENGESVIGITSATFTTGNGECQHGIETGYTSLANEDVRKFIQDTMRVLTTKPLRMNACSEDTVFPEQCDAIACERTFSEMCTLTRFVEPDECCTLHLEMLECQKTIIYDAACADAIMCERTILRYSTNLATYKVLCEEMGTPPPTPAPPSPSTEPTESELPTSLPTETGEPTEEPTEEPEEPSGEPTEQIAVEPPISAPQVPKMPQPTPSSAPIPIYDGHF